MNFQQSWSSWADKYLVPIDDPGSRLFYLNILFSLAFILIWILFQKKSTGNIVQQLRKTIFRKKYWFNRSTRIDYKIYFINSVFKVLLFIPFLDISFHIASFLLSKLTGLNAGETLGIPYASFYILLFSIGSFVFDDFLRFFHHLLMHKVPWLWKLHETHHSAKILTPISLYRTHPLESAMATLRNSVSVGASTALFVFLFSSQLSIFTILGVHLFGFLFNILGSNLRHSHVDFSFGALETIFISPKQHQIHHSTRKEHFDKNFGVSLAIWDKIFGSHLYSKDVGGRLRFGLSGRRQNLMASLGVHRSRQQTRTDKQGQYENSEVSLAAIQMAEPPPHIP